jgi:hypothetical protein
MILNLTDEEIFFNERVLLTSERVSASERVLGARFSTIDADRVCVREATLASDDSFMAAYEPLKTIPS